MTILEENNYIRDLLNVTQYHKANITGKNTTAIILDSYKGKPLKSMESYYTDVFGYATESGHGSNVAQTIHEISYSTEILYFDNTRNKDAVFAKVEELAIQGKCDVINVSMAGLVGQETPDYLRYKELCEKYRIIMVCGSGNDFYTDRVSFPSAYDFTISIGSTNKTGDRVDGFSNKGEKLTAVCPDYVSILNSENKIWIPSGTSYATPVAVGLLLLYISWRKENNLPKLTLEETIKFIEKNCVDILTVGKDWDSGYGLLKLPNLEELKKTLPKEEIPIPHIQFEPEKPKQPEIINPKPIEQPKDNNGDDIIMSYYIKQQLISMNRPKEAFKTLKGIVIHSTANIGATSLNHYNYWNNADRQSSVHFIADWIGNEIYQFIPENEIAWHVGNWTGNREWLGIEMCETNNISQFNIVWNKTVWFVADLCIRHGWNVDDNVWSHNGLRSLYSGVDHTDPYGYLTRMGKSWQQLCIAIEAEIKRRKSIPSPPSPSPSPSIMYRVIMDAKQIMALSNLDSSIAKVKELVDSGKNIKGVVQRNTDNVNVFEYVKSIKSGKIIIYMYPEDERIANYYADHLGVKAVDVKDMTSDMWNSYKEITQIGGQKHNSNVTLLLSGFDAFDTIVATLKHLWNVK